MRVRTTIREIDMASAPAFQAEVEQAVEGGTDDVVLDLREVAYLDSSGLSAIVRLRTELDAADRRLVVANASPNVARVFTITGLEGLLGDG
jgi:anti-anti-sigma factor